MLSCRLFSFKMILQFRLPAIEPEADVSKRGIKKGANLFVKPTYLKLLVSGNTIGINKCKEFTPKNVNFRILILIPVYCLPDFTVSRTRATAQYDFFTMFCLLHKHWFYVVFNSFFFTDFLSLSLSILCIY